jgi:hypothetical protein
MGSTSGSITLSEPAVAGSNTISLPAVTGTVVVAGQNSAITAGTAVASTSGTSIDFTSIPSWVKKITVMFTAVSTNGSSIPQIQLGSGSFTTSGYLGNSFISASGSAGVGSVNSAGFLIGGNGGAGYSRTGIMTINLLTGNTWVSSHSMGDNVNNYVYWGGGSIALGGTLDRVRITTVNGTDTFDAGTINILYE